MQAAACCHRRFLLGELFEPLRFAVAPGWALPPDLFYVTESRGECGRLDLGHGLPFVNRAVRVADADAVAVLIEGKGNENVPGGAGCGILLVRGDAYGAVVAWRVFGCHPVLGELDQLAAESEVYRVGQIGAGRRFNPGSRPDAQRGGRLNGVCLDRLEE